MITRFKSGECFATGRITKGGSTFSKVGARELPLWQASLQVSDTKNEDGTYSKRFITLKAWRKKAEAMPAIKEDSVVFVTGLYSVDKFTMNDGTARERETLTLGDFDVCIPMGAFSPADAYNQFKSASDGVPVSFTELGDDNAGELPF